MNITLGTHIWQADCSKIQKWVFIQSNGFSFNSMDISFNSMRIFIQFNGSMRIFIQFNGTTRVSRDAQNVRAVTKVGTVLSVVGVSRFTSFPSNVAPLFSLGPDSTPIVYSWSLHLLNTERARISGDNKTFLPFVQTEDNSIEWTKR